MYMVTICVDDRSDRFGTIDADNQMQLSLAGKMIDEEIEELTKRFPQVDLDTTAVMPNHIHLLIGLNLDLRRLDPVPLGVVIGALKSSSTVRYIRGVKRGYLPEFTKRLWQAGYYETVIRNDRMAEKYRYYIINNPAAWNDDLEMNLEPE